MTIRNFNDLFKTLQKELNKAMDQVGSEGKSIVKDQIEIDVYKDNPSSYVRTGQLKDSIIYSKNELLDKSINIKIHHDISIMKEIPPSRDNDYMGQHHSTAREYSPQKYAEYTPMTVHYGMSGMIFGVGFWTEPRPYMDNSRDAVEKMTISTIKDRLKSGGFKVL